MARRRRTSFKRTSEKKRAVERTARWALDRVRILVWLGILGACIVPLWLMVGRHEAFAIVSVVMPSDSHVKIPEGLIGQNLWRVDLQALASTLHAQQPDLKQVEVTRRLPGTLEIHVVPRQPVAQVKLSQWHVVDEEGFILPGGKAEPWEHLVMLKGVSAPKEALHIGRENAGERLRSALRIIRQLSASPALTGHPLTAIELDEAQQLTFTIDEDIEVRCGTEADLAVGLARLKEVLRAVAHNPVTIRYIDVRFQDPVIGPKV